MLINLLVTLSSNMKKQGITVSPEQLCLAVKYIFKSDSLTPDINMQTCLKPVLVTSVEDEAGYYNAWKPLIKVETESDKLDLYNMISDSEGQSSDVKNEQHIKKEEKKEGKGEEEGKGKIEGKGKGKIEGEGKGEISWEPWTQYIKFTNGNKNNKHAFENSVRKSIIRSSTEIKAWEKAFEERLEQSFINNQNTESLEELLTKAFAFRKEFSIIKRKWNKTMRAIEPQIPVPLKRNQDKIGEKRFLRPEFNRGMRANVCRWGDPELFMRPMEEIKEHDLLKLQQPIRLMAERLCIRLEGMRKQRTGKMDMRKIMRSAYKTFGEPVKLVKVRPKRKPAKWIILSDVSGSVKHATRLFMSFIFELKNVMDEGIKVFAFVSKVQEITDILQEAEYENMIHRIYEKKEIDFRGYSDYGVAFKEFDSLSGSSIDRETVLLIIGDARNNKRVDRLDLLGKWGMRAGKIIWFNPDLPEKWDHGDSVITAYSKVVNQVHDVSTPGKLVDVIEKLVV